jgi:hypothetical protein
VGLCSSLTQTLQWVCVLSHAQAALLKYMAPLGTLFQTYCLDQRHSAETMCHPVFERLMRDSLLLPKVGV